MSRLFDGVNDVITATIVPIDTGDWTMGCWVYITNPKDAAAPLRVNDSGGTYVQALTLYSLANQGVSAWQNYSTTPAAVDSTLVLASNTWYCIFGTFRASDQRCRVYYGSPSLPVAAAVVAGESTGAGSRRTGGTRLPVMLACWPRN